METNQDSVGIDREHLCETLKAAGLTLSEVTEDDMHRFTLCMGGAVDV